MTLGCGGGGRTTESGSASAGSTGGGSLDITTSTSDGSATTGDASVTQGSMSNGMTTGTGGDGTTTTTSGTTGPETSTSPATDATTGTTGAVSASSSTGAPGPVCGNGLVEEGEECDDGDDLDKNACSNACTKVPCDQQEGGENFDDVLSYIWISNSSQNTVSKIDPVTAANSGEYSGIRRVG